MLTFNQQRVIFTHDTASVPRLSLYRWVGPKLQTDCRRPTAPWPFKQLPASERITKLNQRLSNSFTKCMVYFITVVSDCFNLSCVYSGTMPSDKHQGEILKH